MFRFQYVYELYLMKRKVWKMGRKFSTLTTLTKKSVSRTYTAEKICRCFCTSGCDAAFYLPRKTGKIKFFLQSRLPFTIFSSFIFSFLVNIGVISPRAKMIAR
jgi:hypothetical protein